MSSALKKDLDEFDKEEEQGQMFSVKQKREISDKVQKILRETAHPELPEGEIKFSLLLELGRH